MPIRIAPTDGARLQLTGDVETVIPLSLRALCEGFAVAISDGTLLRGYYDPKLRECRFAVAVEGAGSTSIARGPHGDAAQLSAHVEWISVAAGSEALCPSAASEEPDQTQLELAIGSRVAA